MNNIFIIIFLTTFVLIIINLFKMVYHRKNSNKKQKFKKLAIINFIIFIISMFGISGTTKAISENSSTKNTIPQKIEKGKNKSNAIENKNLTQSKDIKQKNKDNKKSLNKDKTDFSTSKFKEILFYPPEKCSNDVTKRWKYTRLLKDINFSEYYFEYINTYFESDKDVHLIYTNDLSKVYVLNSYGMSLLKNDNHTLIRDAKLAATGEVLEDYINLVDTIEKVK